MLRLRTDNEAADVFFLAALSAFFLLFGLGRGSLASWDEAIYATAARDMLRSGNWLTMTLQGTPWTDKPPLGIWATAVFFGIFGVGEFAARLFSGLCGTLTVIVAYYLGRELFDRWTGFLGAFALLSSSHFFRVARFGVLDAPLTLFLTFALLAFWVARRRNGWFVPFGIALGLAIMTKGFAAFLILPVTVIHCFWAKEREVIGRSTYWIALVLAAFIAMPWYFMQAQARPEAFANDIVGQHFFARVTRPIDGHTGPVWFYFRTLVNKYHPWVLVAVFSAPFFLWKAARERKPEYVFLAASMFGLFTMISLVSTKLHWYIFPVYPVLSLSVGYFLAKWIPERRKTWVKIACVAGMLVHIPLSHHFSDVDRAPAVKAAASVVKANVPAEATVYFYDYHEAPAGYFYFDRKNQYLDSPQELAKKSAEGGALYVVVREDKLGETEGYLKAAGLADVSHSGALRLFMRNA